MTRFAFVTALLLPASPAFASTWIVNTPADTYDKVCDAAHCSLRDAVWEANQSAGNDTIELPSSLGSITLSIPSTGEDGNADGDLDVWDVGSSPSLLHITATGGGTVTIGTGMADRILHTVPSAVPVAVTVSGVSFYNGEAPASGVPGGGCIAHESGGLLTIEGSTFYACRRVAIPPATPSSPVALGGGAIYADSPITIQTTDFVQNSASDSHGAAVYGLDRVELLGVFAEGNSAFAAAPPCSGCVQTFDGGVLYAAGGSTVDVAASEFSFNQSDRGGALAVDGSDLGVEHSRFFGHVVSAEGGAIAMEHGQLHILGSSFQNNSAQTGGALWADPILGPDPIIERSSFVDNATSGSGGALALRTLAGMPDMVVENTTFSANSAAMNGGAVEVIDGSAPMFPALLIFRYSTFAFNTGSTSGMGGPGNIESMNVEVRLQNSLSWAPGGTSNCRAGGIGAFASLGNNSMFMPMANACLGIPTTGDTTSMAAANTPLPLGTYGTLTPIHRLQGIHLDINTKQCLLGTTEDQHGAIRPILGTTCEPGAWEM